MAMSQFFIVACIRFFRKLCSSSPFSGLFDDLLFLLINCDGQSALVENSYFMLYTVLGEGGVS